MRRPLRPKKETLVAKSHEAGRGVRELAKGEDLEKKMLRKAEDPKTRAIAKRLKKLRKKV